MKNTKANLIQVLSALSLASLLLTVSSQTNSKDVEAIGLLLTTFQELRPIITRDPCLPKPYSWLECSYDVRPRVTALILSNQGLMSSSLPDFSAMDALEIIDLSDNLMLLIEFPDFLAEFPKLGVLNLANNYFYGTVPISLMDKSDAGVIKLTLTGPNVNKLCFSDKKSCGTETGTGLGTSPGARSSNETPNVGVRIGVRIAMGVGILILAFVIFLVIVLIIKHRNRKAAAASGQTNGISGLAMPVN